MIRESQIIAGPSWRMGMIEPNLTQLRMRILGERNGSQRSKGQGDQLHCNQIWGQEFEAFHIEQVFKEMASGSWGSVFESLISSERPWWLLAAVSRISPLRSEAFASWFSWSSTAPKVDSSSNVLLMSATEDVSSDVDKPSWAKWRTGFSGIGFIASMHRSGILKPARGRSGREAFEGSQSLSWDQIRWFELWCFVLLMITHGWFE